MPYPVAPPDPPAHIQSFVQSRPATTADVLTAPDDTATQDTATRLAASTLSPSQPEGQITVSKGASPALAALSSPERMTPEVEFSPRSAIASTRSTPAAATSSPLPPSTLPSDSSPQPTQTAPPPTAPPSPQQPTASPAPSTPLEKLSTEGILELKADRQDYDQRRQVFTAEGNVSMRFRGSLLKADRLQVNLLNRFAVAEGNVMLTRGAQVIQGDRFEYNFVQGEGNIRSARGEIYLPRAGKDFAPPLATDISAGTRIANPISEPIYANQPAQNVTGRPGSNITLGARNNPSGTVVVPDQGGPGISRLRFEAEEAHFYPEGWTAENVRITNDPFSPPELELRAKTATLTHLSPLEDELVAQKPRLVFDQGLQLPLFPNRVVLDRRPRQPGLFSVGFDSDDRGGLYLSRSFDLLPPGKVQFSISPQIMVQRAIQKSNTIADWFGLETKISAPFGRGGVIQGRAQLTSFDLGQFENSFRANLRAAQPIPTSIGTHILSLEASYRDRLFNNSLGFQDVQSSLGALFYSPPIVLGKSGIGLSYQVGYQYVNAITDRPDLLPPIALRDNNRVSLSRFQGSVSLSRGFTLWQGKPLPATATEGLRYTPTPVVPYLSLGVGTSGIATAYSSGDWQNSASLTVGLSGQLGHFSRSFLDYTGFNVTYSRSLTSGLSPFLFDRQIDNSILFAGIVQQLYGPIRVGFQTAWNLEPAREISTDYFVEYSRRTYSVRLRYNPVLSLGSLTFSVNDFNWNGGSEPFDGSGITPIVSGVAHPN